MKSGGGMKKIVYLLLMLVMVVGCPKHYSSDELSVRSGVLKRGISMDYFLNLWGPPDRTSVISITSQNEGLYAKWNGFGGTLSSGKQSATFQEWDYEKLGISLLFNESEDLHSWLTNKTVSEIKTFVKPHEKIR